MQPARDRWVSAVLFGTTVIPGTRTPQQETEAEQKDGPCPRALPVLI